MRFPVAVVAGALLASGGVAAAQTVKAGVDAWQRGDFAAAVAAWRPLAQAGDGDAAFDLAQAYKLGRGVPVDLAQARQFYGQAARAGHVQAAANYGLLLFQDGDRKSAMPWIVKAAEGGDPRAQYVYGTALFNGDLIARDWPRAYAMMTRAAAAGLPQATTSLAQMEQFVSAADRQKGAQLASTLAAQPVPAIGRQMVTGGSGPTIAARAPVQPVVATPASPPAPVLAANTAPASRPPAPPRPAAAPKPVAAPKPAKPEAVAAQTRPAPAPAAGGRWQVQLGAYDSEAAARGVWAKIGARLHGAAPRYERAGAFVRLRTGGFADHAAADRACAAARPTPCFAIAP